MNPGENQVKILHIDWLSNQTERAEKGCLGGRIQEVKVYWFRGRVKSVEVMISPFSITFAKIRGIVKKVAISRYDDSVVLWAPSYLFDPAHAVACEIFFGEQESVVTDTMLRQSGAGDYRARRSLGDDY